jgi:hypothetical protein
MAFDIVKWHKLMQILKKTGVDWRERRLISKLYMDQKGKVRLDEEQKSSVKTGRGVRQQCCLSTIIFNLYSEYYRKETLQGFGDFKIGGKVISTVKCTDGLVLLAKEEIVLQSTGDRPIEIARCYGMNMNVGKTKVKRISRKPSPLQIMVDQKQLENVEYFNDLGSMIPYDARCSH